MNTSNIKSYAPKARNAFIVAMSKMAAKYGITEMAIAPMEIKGDLAIIAERPFPKSIASAREALVKTVEQQGLTQTIEKVAYSWFNRLCAIRYMELHDYLGHGRRVLSHQTEPTGYQILEECLDIELAGLDIEKVRELKLDGTKDEELYRELLLAQCHALHTAMPFLFEAIDDEAELLLPENLTKTDSFIHDLVTDIPEEDWQSVEVIGWLYQFYISEKKDEVIGKVVKSEDIAAATQLFTPNWIVKYMVQNSLGAQWLATYPDSPLKAQMEYHIETAEQSDEVKAQLKAITPETLNPEDLTLIDPASGSGHILVEAYDLFKAIYLERGYRQRDIAQLILEKNLFGLDIDQRAAQLTGFALMMKGREDDRRLFERGVKLNVMAMVDSASFDVDTLIQGVDIAKYGLEAEGLTELKDLFEHATTFGSLIQVPEKLAEKLPALKQLNRVTSQDLFVSEAIECLAPLVQQASTLAKQYDAVVANPPYMGGKFFCSVLKGFVNHAYKAGKPDLYGAFILRNIDLAKESGHIGMITIPNWMFLSTFEPLRNEIFSKAPISSLVHNGRGVWGSDFGSCSYVLRRASPYGLRGQFLRLFEKQGSVSSNLELEKRFHGNPRFTSSNIDFKKIPGSPVAYWAAEAVLELFSKMPSLADLCKPVVGLQTGDNDSFIRRWTEVSYSAIYYRATSRIKATASKLTWFPYTKGGSFRKWFGNNENVVNWGDDGVDIRNCTSAVVRNPDYYFKAGISYTNISSSYFGARSTPSGFIFDQKGSMFFSTEGGTYDVYLAFLLSKVSHLLLKFLCPTMDFNPGSLSALPFKVSAIDAQEIMESTARLVEIASFDWDAYEYSWNFTYLPIVAASNDSTLTLECAYRTWITQNRHAISEMKRLEEENNRLFIDAYFLAEELTPAVPIEQITLTVNPAYRYGIKNTVEERDTRFREDTIEELISYAIGCMMGRYSLDEPGLIYANSGSIDFDAARYTKFPADDDGIVPLTDKEWFFDDAANRLVEFISVAFPNEEGKDNLEENLYFLAENLSPKNGEDSRDTIRRYLCDKFYKDHMQTYKKRPIYWLFSSGKQKAFQCLVYLHRYNEGTLARMRTEYVIPLTAKLSTHVNKLENDVEASSSTAEIKKLEKEISQLHKQQVELSTFDEKLRHYADQRISLDLDDGVKVNYGKFGDLLAEVKAIHGKKPEVMV